MNITGVATYKILKLGELANKTVIVVNGLRTNASIITALIHGCERVIPANSVEDALEQKKELGDALLGGEMRSMKIPHFDFGNSPQEFTRDKVEHQVLIHTTSNGTRAINACASAKKVMLGSLLNAEAVAQKAFEQGEDLFLVCTGTEGRLSAEDTYTAGAILFRMREKNPDLVLSDYPLVALKTYTAYKGQAQEFLKDVWNYGNLQDKGFQEDIEYCLQEDIINEVPIFEEGIIRLSHDLGEEGL